MDLGLKDKVAIVTGSSKGLGFATAEDLLNEGANVVIASHGKENLASAVARLGERDNLKAVLCDVTKPEDCEYLVSETIAAFKQLDILITNCGGPAPGSFEDVSMEQWDDAIEKSFKSNLYLIQPALPYLKKSDSASILTVTSFTTKQPLENLILSNAVRSATIGLTKSLAFEFGKYGIRVNSILPGWTLTDRVDALLKNRADKNGSTIETEMSRITGAIPLGRMGDPKEFGRAATFLVSPRSFLHQRRHAECRRRYL